MTGPLDLPHHGDDINIYRVRKSGFVLHAYRYTQDGKEDEHYSAGDIVDLMPHCVSHLVENATSEAGWDLSIAVYGDAGVDADFLESVRCAVEIQVGRWNDSQRETQSARAKAKDDRERAEYARLQAKFGGQP